MLTIDIMAVGQALIDALPMFHLLNYCGMAISAFLIWERGNKNI